MSELLDGPLTDGRPSITCPVCQMRSFHPMDIQEGYCGRCADYTRDYTKAQLRGAVHGLHQQYRTAWTDEYDCCGYCNRMAQWPNLVPWPCPVMQAVDADA